VFQSEGAYPEVRGVLLFRELDRKSVTSKKKDRDNMSKSFNKCSHDDTFS
jgi:hypothetical protein